MGIKNSKAIRAAKDALKKLRDAEKGVVEKVEKFGAGVITKAETAVVDIPEKFEEAAKKVFSVKE